MTQVALPQLNFPKMDFRFKEIDNHLSIFDTVRRKWLVLTPEEWVRQNMVSFLCHYFQVPMSRIANEVSLVYNKRRLRCDSLVYDDKGQALMLIEYKAPNIALTQSVFDQVSVYLQEYQVPYVLVSNGQVHYFCRVDRKNGQYLVSQKLPNYGTLLAKSKE